jgi:hypothetical protein
MREQEAIWNENQGHLKRLQGVKASFDVLKWSKQEKSRKKLMHNMKQYPEKPIHEFRKSTKRSLQKIRPPYSLTNNISNSPRLSKAFPQIV